MIVIDRVTVGHLDHADRLVDSRAVDVFAQQVVIAIVFGDHMTTAIGKKRGQAFDLGVPSFRHSFNRLLPCFVSAATDLLILQILPICSFSLQPPIADAALKYDLTCRNKGEIVFLMALAQHLLKGKIN